MSQCCKVLRVVLALSESAANYQPLLLLLLAYVSSLGKISFSQRLEE